MGCLVATCMMTACRKVVTLATKHCFSEMKMHLVHLCMKLWLEDIDALCIKNEEAQAMNFVHNFCPATCVCSAHCNFLFNYLFIRFVVFVVCMGTHIVSCQHVWPFHMCEPCVHKQTVKTYVNMQTYAHANTCLID